MALGEEVGEITCETKSNEQPDCEAQSTQPQQQQPSHSHCNQPQRYSLQPPVDKHHYHYPIPTQHLTVPMRPGIAARGDPTNRNIGYTLIRDRVSGDISLHNKKQVTTSTASGTSQQVSQPRIVLPTKSHLHQATFQKHPHVKPCPGGSCILQSCGGSATHRGDNTNSAPSSSTSMATSTSSTTNTPSPSRAYTALPRWLLALPLLTLLVSVSGGRKPSDTHPNPHQGAMQLTPWWPTTMAIGETLVVDCGVFIGGEDTPTPIIRWVAPNGKELNMSSNPRVNLTLREKNHAYDVHLSAYRVLTLTLHSLKTDDSGVYKCVTDSPGPDGVLTPDSRNLTLHVLSPDTVCTIEGEDLCGWHALKDETGSEIGWRRLDGRHEISLNRSSGRYDHTYGASKHVGTFLDIDRFRESPPEERVARLQSPQRAPHDGEGCFHFWYIYYGNDHQYLKLKVKPVNSSKEEEKVLFHLNNTNVQSVWVGDWTLAKVKLPNQSRDHYLTFEAKTCVGRCRKSRFIALDDFRFFQESCEHVDVDAVWPNRDLPVRLVNGTTKHEGRVEVLHDAMWGSVCSSQFGNKEAKVICNYLGFKGEGAQGRRKSPDGGANDNVIIWLQRLGCNGTERDLGACIAKGETWGSTDGSCTHETDARVLCGEVAPPPQPTLPVSMDTEKPSSSSTMPSSSTTLSSSTASPSSPRLSTTTPTVIMTTEESHDITTVPPQPTTAGETTSAPKVTSTPPATSGPTPVVVTSPKPVMTSVKTMVTTLSSPTVEPSGGEDENVSTDVGILTTTLPERNVSNTTTDTAHTESPVESKHRRRNTGAVVGISLLVLLLAVVVGVWMYKKRKNRRKSKYIVFSNPKYSREHLPANDISLDSPLTSGSSILA